MGEGKQTQSMNIQTAWEQDFGSKSVQFLKLYLMLIPFGKTVWSSDQTPSPCFLPDFLHGNFTPVRYRHNLVGHLEGEKVI